MVSPQKENGFTPIANELIEQFCYPGINGSEHRVLWFIIRKTYGYQKKQDRISLSQFQKGTFMDRSQAVKTIKSLVAKKILLKEGSVYKLNKNYEEWVVTKRSPSVQKVTTGSDQKVTKSSDQKVTHKRKKETITKETSKTVVLQGEQWNQLIDGFKDVNPMYTDFYKNTTERKALESLAEKIGFDKLLGTIHHLEEITSQPYAPKITKPTELKRDLGKLMAFYKQEQRKLSSNVYEL